MLINSYSSVSESIWYYSHNNTLHAVTSQFDIIKKLGSFEFNKDVIPWMLLSGTIGPYQSWDKRVSMFKPDSKHKQTGDIESEEFVFNPVDRSYSEHKKLLKKTIRESVLSMELDPNKWAISMSGGVDSRALAAILSENGSYNTVTWGLPNEVDKEGSDANIAKRVAEKYGHKFNYFEIKPNNEEPEKVFDAFLELGEGRCDHLTGYLDGFKIWDEISDSGLRGLIRGDEAFGWLPVIDEQSVRVSTRVPKLEDFSFKIEGVNYFEGFESMYYPNWLSRKESETLEQWRDRLYISYDIPVLMGALEQLKSNFVKQVNPLLNNDILNVVKTLPDHLRTDKKLFKEIVDEICPDIPYATSSSNPDLKEYLSHPNVHEYMNKQLEKGKEYNILSEQLIDYAININVADGDSFNLKSSLKNVAKAILPHRLKQSAKKVRGKETLDTYFIKLRVFIILEMYRHMKAASKDKELINKSAD